MKYTLIVLCSVVLLIEVYYRLTKQHETYLESIGAGYYSGYNAILPSWYRIRAANDSFVPANVDFEYPFVTNSWGIRERPIEPKPDTVLRILITGDSYTEGMGAPYDSTWPRLLEKKLNAHGYKVEVINAGFAGSDLFYDYVSYRDSFAKLQPDLVIASLNSSDYTDYLLRGGLDRFHADGTTHYRKAPWYELLFRFSRLFRAVLYKYNNFPFQGIFATEQQIEQEYINANIALDTTIALYKAKAAQNGAGFISIIHIIPSEIKNGEAHLNQYGLAKLDSLANTLSNADVNSINICMPMAAAYGDKLPVYYHLIDGHYNARGYNIMAQIIADTLLAKGLVPVQNTTKHK